MQESATAIPDYQSIMRPVLKLRHLRNTLSDLDEAVTAESASRTASIVAKQRPSLCLPSIYVAQPVAQRHVHIVAMPARPAG